MNSGGYEIRLETKAVVTFSKDEIFTNESFSRNFKKRNMLQFHKICTMSRKKIRA